MFRPALTTHGLWDNLRCDKGSENVLACFVQTILAPLRQDTSRAAVTTVKSTRNTVVERMWVEVNDRVSKPMKRHLTQMVNDEVIDPHNQLHCFAVSTISIKVANIRIANLIEAFNWRRVEGSRGCIPDVARRYCNNIAHLDEHMVPETIDVVNHWVEAGGSITLEWAYGFDPLSNNDAMCIFREQQFNGSFSLKAINRDLNVGDGI